MTKIDSKEALVTAAKKVFAEKGYDGATVKDIADAAGVNVSLVSYHFHGKENLYRSILENFGQGRFEMINRVLAKAPLSIEDFRTRLTLFLEEVIHDAIQEPQMHTIIHRECSSENPITRDIYLGVMHKVYELIVNFMANGQKAGILRANIDPDVTSSLFLGGIFHVIRTDQLRKQLYGTDLNDSAYRESVIQHSIQLLLEGLSA